MPHHDRSLRKGKQTMSINFSAQKEFGFGFLELLLAAALVMTVLSSVTNALLSARQSTAAIKEKYLSAQQQREKNLSSEEDCLPPKQHYRDCGRAFPEYIYDDYPTEK